VKIHVFDSAAETARAAARRIADAVRGKPDLVLGLATGRTQEPVYAALRRLHASGDVNFSGVSTFNLDEFTGIDAWHPGSFRRFMEEQLFEPVGIDAGRIHFLDGMAPDPEAECDRYEARIDAAGGLDLQVLGIGSNGHIGFNEPGGELVSRTHRVRLHEITRRENAARFGGDPEQVPREALSMGMGTILKAATLVLVAAGERKARCIERTVRGPLTTRLPASFLQTHRRVELYLDTKAASLLGSLRSHGQP
jgi:glucosamine-6-phosphate deaminase